MPTDPMKWWRTPKGVKRAYADCRFGQLHYAIIRPATETAVPLVCFHASPTSWRSWLSVLPEMGRDRIVIAPDSPGHGDSDRPPAPPGIADYAAAIGEALERIGIARFDALGNHTGSKVAVEVARQRPHQVRRLVLVSAPIYSEDELAAMKAKYGEVPLAEDGSHMIRRWSMLMNSLGRSLPVEIVARYYSETFRGGMEYEWGHHAAFDYHHAENLPLLPHQVTVFNPKDEIHEATKRAKKYLKNGSVVTLDGSHELLDLEPVRFGRMLRQYLDGPARDIDPATVTAKPAPPAPRVTPTLARRHYIDGEHGQIHYRRTSPANPAQHPLLCLHASPQSSLNYAKLMEVIGNDRIVIAPDTPGYGNSEWPKTAPAIEDFARAMIRLVADLGLNTVDVMGFHTGSLTVTEIARQKPGLVRKIVMYSAPLFAEEELASFRAAYAPLVLQPDGSHTVNRWRRMWKWKDPEFPIEGYHNINAEPFRAGPNSWWGHNAAFNYPFRERLPGIDKPILVLNPNDDLVQHSRNAMPLMKQGRIHELPDYAHGMMDVHTPEIAKILRGFLDG